MTVIDRHRRVYTDRVLFEVRAKRPIPYWDDTLWEDG